MTVHLGDGDRVTMHLIYDLMLLAGVAAITGILGMVAELVGTLFDDWRHR